MVGYLNLVFTFHELHPAECDGQVEALVIDTTKHDVSYLIFRVS